MSNSGEAIVFAITVLPFESTCRGSYVAVPVLVEITNLTGMMTTGTVIDEPVEGASPTML